VTQINRLGRDPDEYDHGNGEYFANEIRDDFFRRTQRQGERDFEILGWGPLVVMDSGSVRFDIGRAMSSDVESLQRVEAPDEAESKEPILASRDYKVSTSLKLGFDPIDAFKEDPTWLVDRYGVNFEVSWLSDVLARETFVTEFEVEWERDGDFAAFVNFVFKSR
jgi:hypothetical protein